MAFGLAAHDAGTLPWVIVGAYAATFAAVAAASRRAPPAERPQWIAAALILLLLGVNKQLDLQSDLTAMIRQAARDGGWYAGRRLLQAGFIVALGIVALVGSGWLLVRFARSRVATRLAMTGLVLLGAFVLLRAASFHHVDILLRTPIAGAKLYAVLELGGIAVVLAGALWSLAPPAAGPFHRPGYRG